MGCVTSHPTGQGPGMEGVGTATAMLFRFCPAAAAGEGHPKPRSRGRQAVQTVRPSMMGMEPCPSATPL